MLKNHPLSEVLLDCLFKNCKSFHHYHPCSPCPSSMLYLLPVDILYILFFYFLSDTFCKNASPTRGCLLLNPRHLEDSMAYNWLPSNICWMNGCVPWFQLQFFMVCKCVSIAEGSFLGLKSIYSIISLNYPKTFKLKTSKIEFITLSLHISKLI